VSRVTHVSSEFWKEGDVDTSLASIRARDDSYNELGAHRTREDQFILDCPLHQQCTDMLELQLSANDPARRTKIR